jgi:hypothetical protein
MKKLLTLLLAAPLFTLESRAAGRDALDPLSGSYNQLSASYVSGDYGYSTGRIDASVALGRVPYLFAVATLGGSDDNGSNNYYGVGIGFRIHTSTASAVDIELGYALQKIGGYQDNHMFGLGLGFRTAVSENVTLVARARYFISNLTVYNGSLYANNFTELSFGPSFYLNRNFSVDAHVSKNIGQYDDFRYGLSATYHF